MVIIIDILGDHTRNDKTNWKGNLRVSILYGRILLFTQHNAGTSELANWDLETVIEKCSARAREIAPEAVNIDYEEGKEWLQHEESIRTFIFNRKSIDTTSRSFSIYKENAELSRYSRRIGKKHIILVEGYEVTKENLALSPLENKSMNNDDVDSDEKHSDKNSDVSTNYH